MKIVLFTHSLLSDWNHGNAHFMRGVATELQARGYEVRIFEPRDAWSMQNLLSERGGEKAIGGFRDVYPGLESIRYDRQKLDIDAALEGAQLVIVHEWNDHDLVARIGAHRKREGNYCLLFHDTHHRADTDFKSMSAYDLRHYDGALVFGSVLRDLYRKQGWTKRVWTWHEAADVQVFRPYPNAKKKGDLVWIGNWGDDERTAELHEYLLKPVRDLKLKATVYGVRYPDEAKRDLKQAGIEYGGWLPNYKVPKVFAQYRVTVHVPRRPYVEALPGIPTIRVFEALACGIPLVSAPWDDVENLFTPGSDFLFAYSGNEMRRTLKRVLTDDWRARELTAHGLRTIHARHTCAHRVDELLNIYSEWLKDSSAPVPSSNGHTERSTAKEKANA